MEHERVFIHNLLMVGDKKTGKTELINAFTKGPPFTIPFYDPTSHILYSNHSIYIDNKEVVMHLCDVSGDPLYSLLNAPSGRQLPTTAAAMLVYDVTDWASFHHLEDVMNQYAPFRIDDERVVKVLVGNKSDLKDERQISYAEGKAFATSKGLNFFETSALTGKNVEYAFVYLAAMYLRRLEVCEV